MQKIPSFQRESFRAWKTSNEENVGERGGAEKTRGCCEWDRRGKRRRERRDLPGAKREWRGSMYVDEDRENFSRGKLDVTRRASRESDSIEMSE